MEKKANILQTLLSIQKSDQQPYFHIEWLVREILKLDEETIEENERWKKSTASGTATPVEGGTPEIGGGDFNAPPIEASPEVPSSEEATPPPAPENPAPPPLATTK